MAGKERPGLAIVLEAAKKAGGDKGSSKSDDSSDDTSSDSPGQMLLDAIEAGDGKAAERAVRLIVQGSGDESDDEDEG